MSFPTAHISLSLSASAASPPRSTLPRALSRWPRMVLARVLPLPAPSSAPHRRLLLPTQASPAPARVPTVRAVACRAANAMAAVALDPPAVAPSPAEVAAVGIGEELPEGYDQMMPTAEPSRRRRAGLLLHPTSLRGPHGIGDLGDEALAFLHWLRDAGCTLWQVS